MNLNLKAVAILFALGVAIAAVFALKQASVTPSSGPAAAKPNEASSGKEAKKALPKLIEIGSESCIPCRAMQPILASLRKKYPDQLEVEFIDIAKNPEQADAYNIQLIPTQVFLDASGKELARHTGFFAEKDIVEKFASLGIRL